jgi:hypothetical protein
LEFQSISCKSFLGVLSSPPSGPYRLEYKTKIELGLTHIER